MNTTTLSLESVKQLVGRIYRLDITAQEIKDGWRQVCDSEESIKAELNKLTKKDLLKYCGIGARMSDAKPRLVGSAFDSLVIAFCPGILSYSPFSETRNQAIDRLVKGWTDELIEDMRQERQRKQEAKSKALANPETLEEFSQFISRRGEDALTDEQKQLRESLLEAKRQKEEADKQARLEAEKNSPKGVGREWLNQHKPEWAQAVIVAELHQDESDAMTDYFHSSVTKTIAIAWSSHTRDLFAEMRKAADTYPETEHLGTGKGLYRVYEKGDPKAELWRDQQSRVFYFPDGRSNYFSTQEEALAAIQPLLDEDEENRRKLEAKEIKGFCSHFPYGYEISGSEKEIEHREKYSMGSGYYLARNSYSGWRIKKVSISGEYGFDWLAQLIGTGNSILKTAQEIATEPRPAGGASQVDFTTEGVVVTLNEEKGGVEVKFTEKPSTAVIDALKSKGFRWSRFNSLWYAKQSEDTIAFANSLKP